MLTNIESFKKKYVITVFQFMLQYKYKYIYIFFLHLEYGHKIISLTSFV